MKAFKRTVSFFSLLFLSSCLHKDLSWPKIAHEPQIHNRVVMGRLENGMDYYYMRHPLPKNQCIVRFYGKVGSFSENDHELGLAHLLEHLVFQSTKDFPKGILAIKLQEDGIAFGPDANAHTSFQETVYKLDLPTCDLLPKALKILRNFADGLVLTKNALDKEKAVIDREENTKDDELAKINKEIFSKLFSGSLRVKRPVIGKKAIRDKINIPDIEAFYHKWYRPHNFSLVIVGDYDININESIKNIFGSWEEKDEKFTIKDESVLDKKHPIFITNNKNSETVAGILMIQPEKTLYPNADLALTKDRLALALAINMLRHRLIVKGDSNASMLYTPNINAYMINNDLYEFTFEVEAKEQNFKTALMDAWRVVKKAMTFGFTQNDLKASKDAMLSNIHQNLLKEKTYPSSLYADHIINYIYNKKPILTEKYNYQLISSALNVIDLADCQEAINKAINSGVESFGLVLNNKNNIKIEEVKTWLKESKEQDIKDFKVHEEVEFRYDTYSKKEKSDIKIVNINHLGIKKATLPNGVNIILKKSLENNDETSIVIFYDDGLLAEGKNGIGKAILAANILPFGGLLQHSYKEVERLMQGKKIHTKTVLRNDFSFAALKTVSKDQKFALDLVSAFLTEPYYHEDILQKTIERLTKNWQERKTQMDYQLDNNFYNKITQDDPRIVFTDNKLIEKISRDDLLLWHKKYFLEQKPVIIIVGDFDENKILKDLIPNIGQIKFTNKQNEIEPKNILFKSGLDETYMADNKSEHGILEIVYPLGMGHAHNAWHTIVRQIIEEELRILLREKDQHTYSPSVNIDLSRNPHIQNYLNITISAPKAEILLVRDKILDRLDFLAKNGVLEEEFNKAKSVYVSSVEKFSNTNNYWMDALIFNYKDLKKVLAPNEAIKMAKDISKEKVETIFAKYFNKKNASVGMVKPK